MSSILILEEKQSKGEEAKQNKEAEENGEENIEQAEENDEEHIGEWQRHRSKRRPMRTGNQNEEKR